MVSDKFDILHVITKIYVILTMGSCNDYKGKWNDGEFCGDVCRWVKKWD